MPLMDSPEGRRRRVVPDRDVSSYLDRGWTVHGQDPPAKSALKAEWVDYANSQGIDTDGLTKAEIVERCG